MKNSTSLGPNGLQADLFKKSSKYTLKAICHIANLSIRTKSFASLWKVAKVIPIWKGDDELEAKNYRPVSLLNPLSRLVEKLVSNQVMKYLEENQLFHENIHGYRKQHGCVTALLEVYEDAIAAQHHGEHFTLNMYDQSAAFDLVDAQIYQQKLEH